MSSSQMLKLGITALRRNNINKLFRRNLTIPGILKNSQQKKDDSDTDVDKPYVYTKSEAYKWSARESRRPDDNAPWYQYWVCMGSIITFMVYFFILREENDVDKIFDRDLKSYFPDMSEDEFRKSMRGSNSGPVS